MRDTKPNLNNQKFEQCVTDIMTLSGCTEVHGILEIENSGVLQILSDGQIDNYGNSGYEISGTSFLRAGNLITSTQVGASSCATGSSSIAIGNADAFGINSIAMGLSSCALGGGNVSIGQNTYSRDSCGTAIGFGSKTYDDCSLAIGGKDAVACGFGSISVGSSSLSCANFSMAMGAAARAYTESSIAIGRVATSCGNTASIAIGLSVISSGDCSTVLGQNSCAIGVTSIAIGQLTTATALDSIAIGRGADAVTQFTIAMGCGAYADGNAGVAIGRNTISSGAFSTALGNGAESIGTNSLAVGVGAYTNSLNGISLGTCAKTAGGSSVSIGYRTYSNSSSIVVGNGSKSYGNCNIVIGALSRVSGGTSPDKNIVLGNTACAFCDNQISIGYDAGCVTTPTFGSQRYRGAISIGNRANSHATTIGQSSIAIGVGAKTVSACSIAIGIGACSESLDNVVIGKYSYGVTSNDSVGIGSGVKMCTASCSVAIGYNINVTGSTNSIGIGRWLCVGGGGSKILMGGGLSSSCANHMYSDCNASLSLGWGVINPTIRFAQNGNSYLDGTSQQFAIGHDIPTAKIDVSGSTACSALRMRDGSETAGYVLTSDGSGYGTWCSGLTGGIGITNSSNGLTDDGNTVCWGGNLTQSTTIDGIGLHSVNYSCLTAFCVGNGVANEQVGVFDVYAEDTLFMLTGDLAGGLPYRAEMGMTQSTLTLGARSGTTNLVRSVYDGLNGGIIVTDDVALKGMCYEADYSTNWTDRSIPDKAYVDSIASGLDAKDAVVVATTASDGDINLVLFAGTIDGITVQDGWRVLIKNQTDLTENGIYDYSGSSSGFTRSSDFDGTPVGEVSNGAFMSVVTGDTLINTQWILTTPDPITIGSSDLTFSLLSQQLGISAGNGIIISTVGSNQEISTRLKSSGGLAFDTGEMYVTGVERTAKAINQSSHGFTVGSAIAFSGGTYVKAIADGTMDAETFGLVSEVSDTNNFVITVQGYVDTISGFVSNSTYFVSDVTAGLLTATEPSIDGHISKPMLATTTTTAGLVLPYRGSWISTGSTAFNQATNGLSVDGTAVKLGGDLCETTTINISSFSLTIGDKPIQYGGDYCAQYNTLSIPDVGFVTGLTSGLQTQIDSNNVDITYLSGQTDLKLNISDFNTYSGDTNTRLDGIDADIAYISGQTNTPGGVDTNVQFNNNDSFSGSSDFTWSQGTKELDIGGSLSISGSSFLRAGTNTSAIELGLNAVTDNVNSIAIGNSGCAIAINSLAIGSGACAIGTSSIAIGTTSEVTGISSIAIGNISEATCDESIAIGSSAKSFGLRSIAIGEDSHAINACSVGLGVNNIAYGISSTALGSCATSCGNYSIAIGFNSCATGLSTIAIGQDVCATGFDSITMGHNMSNSNDCSFALGWETVIPSLFIDGNGSSWIYGNDTTNKFGLGTTGATARLHILATGVTDGFRLVDGNEGIGKVLTSDVNGVGIWSGVGGTSTLTGNTIVGNDASTVFTINHGCGTRDIMVQVYENQTPWGNVLVAVEKPNTACVTLTFDTAPATGEDYRVLMLT